MSKLNLRPIVREETTRERVYKEIKQAILSGKIAENDVFTEMGLAEALDTSRTPVREALLDLTKEGLITTLSRGFVVRKFSRLEIEQIYLLRRIVEVEVIRRLAEMITQDQVEELKRIYELQVRAEKKTEQARFVEIDHQFHLLFSDFSGYGLIKETLMNLYDLVQLISLYTIKRTERMAEVLVEHKKIIDALEAKDADLAADSLREHLENSIEAFQF